MSGSTACCKEVRCTEYCMYKQSRARIDYRAKVAKEMSWKRTCGCNLFFLSDIESHNAGAKDCMMMWPVIVFSKQIQMYFGYCNPEKTLLDSKNK